MKIGGIDTMIQLEHHILLSDDENKTAWDEIYKRFKFKPDVDITSQTFAFKTKYTKYNIVEYFNETSQYYQEINDIFKKCLGSDTALYALDWQHSGFSFNPNSTIVQEKCEFVEDDRFSHGGYNTYFPSYYPDGDYHFFIDKDYSWGYFGHPWKQQVWVFGESIIKEFEEKLSVLPFASIT